MSSKAAGAGRPLIGPAYRLARRLMQRRNGLYDLVSQSGLFDEQYYRQSYPNAVPHTCDAVQHYVDFGANQALNPNRWFDTVFYLRQAPHVKKRRENPLVHFYLHGAEELLSPCAEFDAIWYVLMHMGGNKDRRNPLLHYLETGAARETGVTPPAILTPAVSRLLRAGCASAIEYACMNYKYAMRITKYLEELKLYSIAEVVCKYAATLRWNDAAPHKKLASLLQEQQKWWEVADELELVAELSAPREKWWFALAESQEKMKRWPKAASSYKRAIALGNDAAQTHFLLGHALEQAGKRSASRKAYANAVAKDDKLDARRFGIGVFHQARSDWPNAADAYDAQLQKEPFDAQLHYKAGLAHDRCYQWSKAEQLYKRAASLSPTVAAWHFRLGFVLERQERWIDAARAYTVATLLSDKQQRYWHYRRGFVLEKAQRYEDAASAYLDTVYGDKYQAASVHDAVTLALARAENPRILQDDADVSRPPSAPDWLSDYDHSLRAGDDEVQTTKYVRHRIDVDPSNPDAWCQLAVQLSSAQQWPQAAAAYASAIARADQHAPAWYYQLGQAYRKAGEYKKACEAFHQCRILQGPHGRGERAFDHNERVRLITTYTEYYEDLDVDESVILYESFNGNSIAGNPLALFKALTSDPKYSSYKHVWVINDKTRVPSDMKSIPNVAFMARETDGYLRCLCTAKYLINNSAFPTYFIRKPEQQYLATWHGTPLKTLGKDEKYKFQDYRRMQRNFLQSTHIISPNPHTTKVLLDSYDLRELYSGAVAETGYPRIDSQFSMSAEAKSRVQTRLHLKPTKPVVLYAPTWRGTLDAVHVDIEQIRTVARIAQQCGCQLLFRAHSLMEDMIASAELDCTIVPADIDTNELFPIIDILITDYSSVFFDFLATSKPIVFFAYDEAAYAEHRGLYFPVGDMPGHRCADGRSLASTLTTLAGKRTGTHNDEVATKTFSPHDDGNASKRVIEFFFDGRTDHHVDLGERPDRVLLFHVGALAPNGITTSFRNLVNALDRKRYRPVLLFSPNSVEEWPDRLEQFHLLPADVTPIARCGQMNMTWEERSVRARQLDGYHELKPEQKRILRRAYGRELRRLFGDTHIGAAISFAGYEVFWTSVFCFNNERFTKVIYLHNDMYGEYLAKYPRLEHMFRVYNEADKLVSVSRHTNDLNRSNLAERYKIDAAKFVSCENLQAPESTLASARKALPSEEDARLFEKHPTFLNVARLSVEKDHAKLIRAFGTFSRTCADARLLIMGTGPQRHNLENLIEQHALGAHVTLLGYRANPYPYIRRSDCFILSSNHEGQPMTLLEALILEKPVIATDIPGNRSVLEGRPGLLVENSENGLVEGMQTFTTGRLQAGEFNWREYQAGALSQFYENVAYAVHAGADAGATDQTAASALNASADAASTGSS
jgi:CDP-glycerol glycerophosphotransferase